MTERIKRYFAFGLPVLACFVGIAVMSIIWMNEYRQSTFEHLSKFCEIAYRKYPGSGGTGSFRFEKNTTHSRRKKSTKICFWLNMDIATVSFARNPVGIFYSFIGFVCIDYRLLSCLCVVAGQTEENKNSRINKLSGTDKYWEKRIRLSRPMRMIFPACKMKCIKQ